MVWRSWPIRSYIHMPGRPTLMVSAMTLLAKFSAPDDGMVVGTWLSLQKALSLVVSVGWCRVPARKTSKFSCRRMLQAGRGSVQSEPADHWPDKGNSYRAEGTLRVCAFGLYRTQPKSKPLE